MNFRIRRTTILLRAAILLAAAAGGVACKESLPVYVDPQHVMQLSIAAVEQLDDHLAPPGKQAVRIVLRGVNSYDEPFLDSVRFDGTMKITWERQPTRTTTIRLKQSDLVDPSLVSNGKMLLVPGQAFLMEVFWNMRSDDGVYLPGLMNFAWLTRRICAPNVACADPETFIVEATLSVYDRLGPLSAPPASFTFVGRLYIK